MLPPPEPSKSSKTGHPSLGYKPVIPRVRMLPDTTRKRPRICLPLAGHPPLDVCHPWRFLRLAPHRAPVEAPLTFHADKCLTPVSIEEAQLLHRMPSRRTMPR